MNKTFGFIGCGNMGGALAKAVSAAGYENDILLADINSERVVTLAKEISAEPSDALKIANECKFIFIGVKPQVIDECFNEIKESLKNRNDKPVIVSMAAGVAINRIAELSGIDSVIRIMPNMPVSVGSGVVLAASKDVCEADKASFERSMCKAGVFDWLEEKYIDAASALSGCGPAFAYMFAQALADGAVACGLPRDKAILYSAGTLLGSAKMILETGKHPEKLKDDVCSPGGSTIMGVKALEDEGMRGAAINAVLAAYKRTKELG